jgi:hypothetical protein
MVCEELLRLVENKNGTPIPIALRLGRLTLVFKGCRNNPFAYRHCWCRTCRYLCRDILRAEWPFGHGARSGKGAR